MKVNVNMGSQETVYKKIRRALFERDLTIRQMAIHLGEDPFAVYNVLSGKYGATSSSVVGRRIRRRVARFLKLKVADLWPENGAK